MNDEASKSEKAPEASGPGGLGPKWQPGQSGNPAGKPKGTRNRASRLVEAMIGNEAEQIVRKVIDGAIAGDPVCMRLALERLHPPLKAAEQAVSVELPGKTLTERGRAVLAAIEAGELAPAQGAALLSAIGTLARVAEIDELVRRVEALEGRNHGRG